VLAVALVAAVVVLAVAVVVPEWVTGSVVPTGVVGT
jgi:hypothetical protein